MPTPAPALPCPACGNPVPLSEEVCSACGQIQATDRTLLRPAAADTASTFPELLDGKWRLDRKLGRGGMGTVYLAYEIDLDRRVAIKMLAENLCEDQQLVQRFEREARMMAKLDHPNLVPVHAVGRAGKVPFIVMKFLEGSSLSDTLRARGRLELAEVLSITRQICAGLQYVHEHDVVHRDVKPANVFIAPDGRVTLLDLGVARDSASELTRSGVMVGTPRYMPPEQILGLRTDYRADLYALATVVYEMLTGQAVFEADSDYSIMKAHIDQPPVNPLELAEMPEGVAAAILKGLAKGVEQRFQSAQEFMDALDAAAGQTSKGASSGSTLRPIAVTMPPRNDATPRPLRRTRPAAQATPRPPTPAPSQRPTGSTVVAVPADSSAGGESIVVPRSRTGFFVLLGALVLVGGGVSWAVLFNGSEPPAETLTVKPPNVKPADVKPADVKPADVKPADVKPADVKPAEVKPAEVKPAEVKPAEVVAAVVPPVKPGEVKPRADRPIAKAAPAEVRCTVTAGGELSWAYVDVDGNRQGATPLLLKLEPGKHVVVFQRDGFKTQTRELTVSAGELKKLQVELGQ